MNLSKYILTILYWASSFELFSFLQCKAWDYSNTTNIFNYHNKIVYQANYIFNLVQYQHRHFNRRKWLQSPRCGYVEFSTGKFYHRILYSLPSIMIQCTRFRCSCKYSMINIRFKFAAFWRVVIGGWFLFCRCLNYKVKEAYFGNKTHSHKLCYMYLTCIYCRL